MKHLHFDCFSGISGDMTLGALLDLGVPLDYLKSELQALQLHENIEIVLAREERLGISGNRVRVLHNQEEIHESIHDHEHHEHHHHEHHTHHEGHHHHSHHQHEHGHHHHEHGHHHEDHKHDHVHRPYRVIRELLEKSTLKPRAKALSQAIFYKLAVAEAKIHGTSVEEISFHEVGAIDAIVDIVGTAILIDTISPERISASPLPMGHGFVRCAHGRMPVPAPATLEILRQVPLYDAKTAFELVTPTGAAIIATLAHEYSHFASITPQNIGYGLGKRQLPDRPNVLRVVLGESY